MTMGGPFLRIGSTMSILADVVVHSPPTRFFASCVEEPHLDGSKLAQEGIEAKFLVLNLMAVFTAVWRETRESICGGGG